MKLITNAMNSKAMQKVGGTGNALNWGLSGVTGVMMYNDARAEGKGAPAAFAEATVSTAFFNMLGLWPSIGLMGGMMAYEGGKAAVTKGIENERNYAKLGTASPFSNATFVDSEQAYTMRQAGMTMIQQNAMNTKKAVMGNEAMYMHQ